MGWCTAGTSKKPWHSRQSFKPGWQNAHDHSDGGIPRHSGQRFEQAFHSRWSVRETKSPCYRSLLLPMMRWAARTEQNKRLYLQLQPKAKQAPRDKKPRDSQYAP